MISEQVRRAIQKMRAAGFPRGSFRVTVQRIYRSKRRYEYGSAVIHVTGFSSEQLGAILPRVQDLVIAGLDVCITSYERKLIYASVSDNGHEWGHVHLDEYYGCKACGKCRPVVYPIQTYGEICLACRYPDELT